MKDAEALIVLTTVPDMETARAVARAAVEKRLAACVHIAPAGTSLYWWEGKIAEEAEHTLIIKTRPDLYDALESGIRAVHPYTVPEILAVPAVKGARSYLDWIRAETRPESP